MNSVYPAAAKTLATHLVALALCLHWTPAAQAQARPDAPIPVLTATPVLAPALSPTLAPAQSPSPSPALASASTATRQQTLVRQDPTVLRQSVEQFLQRQSSGLPGQATIEVGQIDSRVNLPACVQPEPFLAHGSKAWGKTAVGIRCTAPSPWTIYVTAHVRVMAEYLAAAAPLAQGQTIGQNDFVRIQGDLTQLPAGVITDPAMAIGRTTMSSLPAGAPLRQDTLRAQAAVQMGQTVRLLSSGSGFTVTTEGRALNNAAQGQTVQAKTPAGQVISGIARAGGILEVGY